MRQHAGKDRKLSPGQGETLGVKVLDLQFPKKTWEQRQQEVLKMGGGPGHTLLWASLLYTVFPFTILKNHSPSIICVAIYTCVYL